MGAFFAQPNQPAFEPGRSVAAGGGERVLLQLQTQTGADARRIQIPPQTHLRGGCSYGRIGFVLHVLPLMNNMNTSL